MSLRIFLQEALSSRNSMSWEIKQRLRQGRKPRQAGTHPGLSPRENHCSKAKPGGGEGPSQHTCLNSFIHSTNLLSAFHMRHILRTWDTSWTSRHSPCTGGTYISSSQQLDSFFIHPHYPVVTWNFKDAKCEHLFILLTLVKVCLCGWVKVTVIPRNLPELCKLWA